MRATVGRLRDEMAARAGIVWNVDDLRVEEHRHPPEGRDQLVTVVLLCTSLVQILLTDTTMPAALAVPAAVAAAVAYDLRHTTPLISVALALTAHFGTAALAMALDQGGQAPIGQTAAVIAVTYAATRWLRVRLAAVITTTVIVGVIILAVAQHDSIQRIAVETTPWILVGLLAIAMRYRHRLLVDQYERVRLTERQALARDLHDTIAHHATAIAVQAQAARFAAGRGRPLDPEVFIVIADSAQKTLWELDQLAADDDPDEAPTVRHDSLVDLVHPEERPAVAIIGEADLTPFPTEVATTIYRIAQEAVSNARRHSNNVSSIDIDLRHSNGSAVLSITNDGTPTRRNRGGGFGTTGMRERAEALGGTIYSGPAEPNGWRVDLSVPIASPTQVGESGLRSR